MRRIVCIFLIVLFAVESFGGERKKVGLVLGGGGAKGVSHIGVLKVLEEAGIPVDYVVGTSMGAIVGGLYSIGYTPYEIDSIVRIQEWNMLLSDRVSRNSQSFPEKQMSERYILSLPLGIDKRDRLISGVIRGQNIQNLFSNLTIGYHDNVDFNTLKRPFACVSFNLVDGKDYVFREGSLPVAMRASMAIPAVFVPVRMDSMVLIDGGLINNYPADIVREMGADIVIGVDLGTNDLKEFKDINATSDIIGQLMALYAHDTYKVNRETTDLLFRPNMKPFTAASFFPEALDSLINRGEQEARQRWDEIIALKEKIGIDDSYKDSASAGDNRTLKDVNKPFFIKSISIEGVEQKDEKRLVKISGLEENSYTTINNLNNAISILIGTVDYTDVRYELKGERQEDLVLKVRRRAVSSLNLGLRFDTEEIMAVLLNITYHRYKHSKFALSGRVGRNSYARLDYTVERTPLRNVNLASQISYKDLDIYSRGKKSFNTGYMHYLAELGYTDMNWLNFKFQVGARYEYFNYKSALHSEGLQTYDVRPEGFVSYFGLAHYETFDRRHYPNKGVSLKAEYSMYTDNLFTYKGELPFSAISGTFTGIIRTSSRFSMIPSLYGRVLLGDNVAYPYMNVLGGDYPEKYVPQQLPFAGIYNMEILDKSLIITQMQLRYRFAHSHYLSFTGNYGVHNNDFEKILNGSGFWGAGISYGYNSFVGPMNVNLGYSNHTEKPQVYISLGYNF